MPDDTTRTRLRRALLDAYPDRVVLRRANDARRGLLVGGRGVQLARESGVTGGELFLAIEIRDIPGQTESLVTSAVAIERAWLAEQFPHLVTEGVSHTFDREAGRVRTYRETRYAGLAIDRRETGAREDPDGASAVLADALASDPAAFLAPREDVARWVARVRFLARAMPDLGLPEYGDGAIAEAIRHACAGCRSVADVDRAGALNAFRGRMEWQHTQAVDRHAPATIPIVGRDGRTRNMKLRYPGGPETDAPPATADAPVLAIKIQHAFGWRDTPRVADGRVPVVLHLLAPNGRPAQVTTDLASFWKNGYPQVRKELRGRYPKHDWPEVPPGAAD